MDKDIELQIKIFIGQELEKGTSLSDIQTLINEKFNQRMTYMDVRFLLLDHGIEIATAAVPVEEKKPEPATEPETTPQPAADGKLVVTLDELTLPGTLISGKVQFDSGTKGGWQIDQMRRIAWNSLEGQPTPEELQAFQMELTQILSRA